MPSYDRRRRVLSRLIELACAAAVVAALVPLGSILYLVLSRGIGGINLAFFTQLPRPVGESGGGMVNAILGSALLAATASLLAVPIGVVCGVHLAEYRSSRLSTLARFSADVLNGVPSIVIGIFAYAVAVMPFRKFSAMAGAFALGVMMLPLVIRTTEEILLLVPAHYREGALALGASRARAVWTVLLPAALPGILTGVLVALARIAGETAPLLFTAFNNRYGSMRLDEPIASLPVQIYTYAVSPYQDWHRQAWAGAAVLIFAILLFSLLARAATRRIERMHRG